MFIIKDRENYGEIECQNLVMIYMLLGILLIAYNNAGINGLLILS